jgi:hypothetical protein
MLLSRARLRLCEALALRLQDVDLARGELLVRPARAARNASRAAGGPRRGRSRRTRPGRGRCTTEMRPQGWRAAPPRARAQVPAGAGEWPWYSVFPARRATALRTGAAAAAAPPLGRPAGPRPRRSRRRPGEAGELPHAPAQLRDGGAGAPPAGGWLRPAHVRELLGHRDVRTTMIYTHVLGPAAWRCAARPTGTRRLRPRRAGVTQHSDAASRAGRDVSRPRGGGGRGWRAGRGAKIARAAGAWRPPRRSYAANATPAFGRPQPPARTQPNRR